MDVDDAASLEHQLPDELVRHTLIEIADIDGRFLVLLPGEGVSSSSRSLCFARVAIGEIDGAFGDGLGRINVPVLSSRRHDCSCRWGWLVEQLCLVAFSEKFSNDGRLRCFFSPQSPT